MTPAEFEAELYNECEWRMDEVAHLKNLITNEKDESLRGILRKSLVVVLYSHFEGFCVFSLEHYLNAINSTDITCDVVAPAILAGAWETLFNAMEHGDQKCKIFKNPLPHDVTLHRHWRRRHFVEQIEKFRGARVVLGEDIIDSESNLKPQVLQRNLFILGLDHTFVDPYADTIQRLLGRRNRIAHGDDRRGVSAKEYGEYETAVFDICFKLIEFLDQAFSGSHFERRVPEYVL